MSSEIEALKEKLAAIEHERWSDWMEYMLDCAVKSGDDNIGIRTCGWPTAQFEHWQRQIETDYEDLSDKEKASDMEQVDRYWPLIVRLLTEARLDELRWADKTFESELTQLQYSQALRGRIQALNTSTGVGEHETEANYSDDLRDSLPKNREKLDKKELWKLAKKIRRTL